MTDAPDVIGRGAREAFGDTGRQCTATSKGTGDRCKSAPIPGGAVCSRHGGKAPQVQQSARQRLLAMVDPVMGAFEDILNIWSSTRCPTCGNPTGDPMHVIRVGQLVLDRAGFHPTLTVQQSTPATPAYFQWLKPEQLAQMTTWMAEAKHAMEQGEPQAATALLPEATDAVLVDEDDASQEPTT
jgi:hypothetical protein